MLGRRLDRVRVAPAIPIASCSLTSASARRARAASSPAARAPAAQQGGTGEQQA